MAQSLRSPEMLLGDTELLSKQVSARSTHSTVKQLNKTAAQFHLVMGRICPIYLGWRWARCAHAKASAEQISANQRGCTQQPRTALSVGAPQAPRTDGDLTAHRMGNVLQCADHRSRTRRHRTVARHITGAFPNAAQLILSRPPLSATPRSTPPCTVCP